MAAVANPELVTLTINDVELQVPKGELIVEAVKRLGLEIPIFCYHSRLKPVGMCRMCLVEVGFKQPDGSVRKMPKPQAGCTLPADNNMVVYTDSEMVHRDRKGVLEFLLANHPLDCPICDRGGECPLQNNTLFYGPSTSRYVEVKRHAHKAFPLSKHVTLDLERCIQCGRCVRFTEEISGDGQLAFRFRGADMQPSTFELTDFTSKFSGNVIEICPVGALTSSEYRFRARPWDLQTSPAICTVCSNGCNVWFDHRVGKMVRINGRTNEGVNEEWTCDKGKFGHDFYNASERLERPLIRRGDALAPCSWSEAYDAIANAFAPGGNQVAFLGGDTLSNEAIFLLQKLVREQFMSHNLDWRTSRCLPKGDFYTGVPLAPTPIAKLETKGATLVFGTSLADDLPIYYLRLRKAWFNHNAKVIVATAAPTDADDWAHLVLRYKPGTEQTFLKGLASAALATGKGQSNGDVVAWIGKETPESAANTCGISVDALKAAASALVEAGGPILTSDILLNLEDGETIARKLHPVASMWGGDANFCTRSANAQGAIELGLMPDYSAGGMAIQGEAGLGTEGILKGCADGSIQALWVIAGEADRCPVDPIAASKAIENVPFLVVQATTNSELIRYASVVLPMTAPAEGDGTYTSAECRVQRMKPILPAKGEAKEPWKIFADLLLRTQSAPTAPYFGLDEVMDAIASIHPDYEGARYDRLPAEGHLMGEPSASPATPAVEA